ncbi:HlyD family type I secretion periplasmic adaptor subunit [Rhizobium deserti]|uniref:Membrane fusion protein (MFP) family protein n=1 Tax=Rhizobium deserti TaxID=2547961 RepID=A0A4R5U6B5_9HYPH|nr:HlyD family type I secretion periplasmic adaptor subunit [Rhizobium deserti]TDK29672.1 HlyD family type I secretion periplasmic adaptor subunit [Rhizobium deserti]
MQKNVATVPTRTHIPSRTESPLSLASRVRSPAVTGVIVVMIFVAGAIGWSASAPIAAGAVASGVISPDGSRRTVQHLEGGIIRKIMVRDGDDVAAGQVLIVLQTTQAASVYDMLMEQAQTLTATRARLLTEQAGKEEIDFSSALLTRKNDGIQVILDGQTSLFHQRRKAFHAQLDVLKDRVHQYQEQVSALQAQAKSASTQIDFIDEELKGKNSLFRQGLTTKSDVLRLERAKAALQGDYGRATGSILEVRQKIGELATQKISLEADRAEEVSTELEKIRAQYAEVSEKLHASRDILERTSIIAPISGRIVNSKFKTDSGVIKPGEAIMDIVPTGEQLLIDVHISPNDIDVVRPDLQAIVHLSAYSSSGMPRINGLVRSVSADRIVDPNTGQPYFLARVEVAKEDFIKLGNNFKLLAGMPAEVTIVTEERTVLEYLLEPFLGAFRRGIRET